VLVEGRAAYMLFYLRTAPTPPLDAVVAEDTGPATAAATVMAAADVYHASAPIGPTLPAAVSSQRSYEREVGGGTATSLGKRKAEVSPPSHTVRSPPHARIESSESQLERGGRLALSSTATTDAAERIAGKRGHAAADGRERGVAADDVGARARPAVRAVCAAAAALAVHIVARQPSGGAGGADAGVCGGPAAAWAGENLPDDCGQRQSGVATEDSQAVGGEAGAPPHLLHPLGGASGFPPPNTTSFDHHERALAALGLTRHSRGPFGVLQKEGLKWSEVVNVESVKEASVPLVPSQTLRSLLQEQLVPLLDENLASVGVASKVEPCVR
jgi:hypothetical protein